jgi:formylglycine-generating enzyme required for sulfatase activity
MCKSFIVIGMLCCLASLLFTGCSEEEESPAEIISASVTDDGELRIEFDKEVTVVKVNGTPANVSGTIASWENREAEIQQEPLTIEWTDRNGNTMTEKIKVSIGKSDSTMPEEPPITGEDNAPMALIPAGEFLMGSNDGNPDEKPVHTVYLNAFYIDVYEVTGERYQKFLEANPRWRKGQIDRRYHDGSYLEEWNGINYPRGEKNCPAYWVSWYAAMAYAEWAGKRLPTEAEWEKAARGGLVGKRYPWGNDDHINKYANGPGGEGDWSWQSPVGSFAPNGYGLYDIAGNVIEWCADWYDANYYAVSPEQNPTGPSSGEYRVFRGGGWNSALHALRVAWRGHKDPRVCSSNLGFRCAKDAKL